MGSYFRKGRIAPKQIFGRGFKSKSVGSRVPASVAKVYVSGFKHQSIARHPTNIVGRAVSHNSPPPLWALGQAE